MGLFTKLKSLTGAPSAELLENGVLGRGVIVGVRQTSMSVGQGDMDPHRVCTFTVEVTLDNQAPYEATCRQAIPLEMLPQFQPGKTMVAVRVSPTNPQEIALDLATEVPTVTRAREPGQLTAAEILETGAPARAIIVQSQPINQKNQEGVDLYALMLTMVVEGREPYQITVGNPVPETSVPLLYPGSNLPAKIITGNDKAVAIDWQAAKASFTSQPSQ